ncbi:MAG: hypothetical protein QGI86_05600 [Candidatus Poribacteria bacterium]|nr:hypothetical protein [Candidatus Poribacteria bacterium]MDP6999362.1 hypothetical protein [Candidatus Poribacteria bacterium]
MATHTDNLPSTKQESPETCSKTIRLRYKGNTDFNRNTYDLNIDVDSDSGCVHLTKGVTYADEMGNCTNRDIEAITRTQWIRKEFWIDQPEADRAELLVYVKNKPRTGSRLHITVNDQQTVIFEEPKNREYWNDCWNSIPIPLDALCAGLNRFIFQAEGEERWDVLVEQSRLPDRSAKSRDAGRNWDDQNLGLNDACDGEYMIRLKLEQYPSGGKMLSDTIDIGQLVAPDGIAVPFRLDRLESNLETEAVSNTKVDLSFRFGSTPDYSLETWTDWISTIETIPEQLSYFQWQMSLSTDNSLLTPVVKELEIEMELSVPEPTNRPKLEIIQRQVPESVRSSHRFSYLPSGTKRA